MVDKAISDWPVLSISVPCALCRVCFACVPVQKRIRYGDESGGYKKPSLKLPTTAVQPTPILLSPREMETEKRESKQETKREADWYDDEVID